MSIESVDISENILEWLNAEYPPPLQSGQKWKIDHFSDESEWRNSGGSLISHAHMSFIYSYEGSPFQLEMGSVRDDEGEWFAFIEYKKDSQYDEEDNRYIYESDHFSYWEDAIDQAVSHFYEKQKLEFDKFYRKAKRANEVIQAFKNSQG